MTAGTATDEIERFGMRLTDYEGSCLETGQGQMIRHIMDRIGDKWSLLVIGTLAPGPIRFTDLHAHVPGVSRRMLTVTLRQLERDGLATRTSYPEVPPRVEYALTELGRTLIAPASALAAWAIDHREEITAARADFDAAHPRDVG